MKMSMETRIWVILLFTTSATVVSANPKMSCSYAGRGSLTATCVNADSEYIKLSPYNFDHLDITFKCINCTLSTIHSRMLDRQNRLKNLDLSSSRIVEIERTGFMGLIFLEKMNLSYNEIKYIVNGTFHGIQMVRTIDISHNKISSICDGGFENLKHLEYLDLRFNSIEIIGLGAFTGLSSLIGLNLGNNKITNVHKEDFANMTALKILNLRNNHINSLEGDEFTNLPALVELDLGSNKLIAPMIDFKPKNNLKRLFLDDNNISKLTGVLKGMESLEELDLSNNNVREVGQKTLRGLLQLHILDLSRNELGTFRIGQFSGLPHLEVLNCSHNKISEIEFSGIRWLYSLHTLDLSFNSLIDLDYASLINRIPNLSYLKLENNSLPGHFEQAITKFFSDDNLDFVLDNPHFSFLKSSNHNKAEVNFVATTPSVPSVFIENTVAAIPQPIPTGTTESRVTSGLEQVFPLVLKI